MCFPFACRDFFRHNKINAIGLATVSAEKANFNAFNIGHHGSSFKLLE